MRDEKTTLNHPGRPFFPKPLLLVNNFLFLPCVCKDGSFAVQYKYLPGNHTSFNVCLTLEHPASCWDCRDCFPYLTPVLMSPMITGAQKCQQLYLFSGFCQRWPFEQMMSRHRDAKRLSGFGDMNGFSIAPCFGNVSCNWNLIFQQVSAGCYLQTMWMLHFSKWHLD